MKKHVVGPIESIPDGTTKIVNVGGQEIGVFNFENRFFAVFNRCPHQGAPVCRGTVEGTCLPSARGEYLWSQNEPILRCPWHGWEFRLTDGRAVFDPQVRLTAVRVAVEDDQIVLTL